MAKRIDRRDIEICYKDKFAIYSVGNVDYLMLPRVEEMTITNVETIRCDDIQKMYVEQGDNFNLVIIAFLCSESHSADQFEYRIPCDNNEEGEDMMQTINLRKKCFGRKNFRLMPNVTRWAEMNG